MKIDITVNIDDKQIAKLFKPEQSADGKQLDLIQAARIAELEGLLKLIAKAIGCETHTNEMNIVECAGAVRSERDIIDERCKVLQQANKELVAKATNLKIDLEDAKREATFQENLRKYPDATSRDYTGAPMEPPKGLFDDLFEGHKPDDSDAFEPEQPHDPPADPLPPVEQVEEPPQPPPLAEEQAEPPKEDIPEGLREFELGLEPVQTIEAAASYWSERAASVPAEWHERAKTSLVSRVAVALDLEPSEVVALIKKETASRKATAGATTVAASTGDLATFKAAWDALQEKEHTEQIAVKLIMSSYAKDGSFHKSDVDRAVDDVCPITGFARHNLVNKLTSVAAKIFANAAKVKLVD